MAEQAHGAQPLDAWHYFEVLDRSSVFTDLFDRALAAHPVVASDDQLRTLVAQAGDLLGAIYQRAGTLLEERADEMG